MLGHLETVLGELLRDPAQRLSDLPLLNAAERQQLLHQWNSNEAAYPVPYCLHQLFEQQAELTPENIALVCEGHELTYGELNARANQLAHYLISQGVGPESRVGLCLDRSLEMVIALLGILKTGAAYVPLDPSYPEDRLAFMREDACLSCLIDAAFDWQQLLPAFLLFAESGDYRAARQCRLHDLYLRFHRPAQGRSGFPCQRRPSARGHRPPLPLLRFRYLDPVPLLRLRLLRLGDLGRSALRRQAAGGSLLDQPFSGSLLRTAPS